MSDESFSLFGLQIGLGEIIGFAALIASIAIPYHLFFKSRRIEKIEAVLADPAARKLLCERYEEKRLGALYFQAVRRLDAWADRFFDYDQNSGRRGLFSVAAFVRCLQLAFIYPFLFLLVGWALGASGEFGPIIFLPDNSLEMSRWLIMGVSVGCGSLLYLIVKNQTWFVARIQLLLNLSIPRHGKRQVTHDVMIVSFAFAVFGIVLIIAMFALGILVAVALAAIDRTTASSASFVLVFGITVSVAAAVNSNAIIGLAGSAFLLSALARFGIFQTVPDDIALVLLAWALLPLLNAAFDWLSAGATRWLLKAIGRGESLTMIIFHVALDLLLALIFLGGLTLVLPFVSEMVLRLLDIPFDWRGWIARAQSNPWPDGIPLFAMLVSTLLPTMVHFTVGIGAIFANRIGSYRKTAREMKRLESEGFHTLHQQDLAKKILKAQKWYIPSAILACLIVGGLAWMLFHYLDGLGLGLASLALWSGDLAARFFAN